MSYPDDKLYLRVGVLIDSLMNVCILKHDATLVGIDFDLYQYLKRVKLEASPNHDINRIKVAENFLLSNEFIKSDVVGIYKDTFIKIIRDYKLKLLEI